MDNLKIVQEWFDIAEMDLSSAKYLQNMRPTPIEIICYHYNGLSFRSSRFS